MFIMQKTLKLLFVSCIALLMFNSCYEEKTKSKKTYHRAATLLESHPDSTLQLLNSIVYPQNMGDKYYYRYLLLKVQAEDKCFQNLAEDSIIFDVKAYFKKNEMPEETALACYYAGRVVQDSGDNDKALLLFNEAEKFAAELDDYRLKGQIQSSIGNTYYNKFTFDEAILRYKLAANYSQLANAPRNNIIALNKIGNSFQVQKIHLDSALYYYNKALLLARETKDNSEQGRILNNIGSVLLQQSRSSAARVSFRRAIDAYEKEEDKATAYFNIARSFIKESRDSAVFYIDKAKALDPLEKNNAIQKNVQYVLANVAMQNKDYNDAMQHMRKYTQYLDKDLKATNNQQMLEIQRKYNYERIKNENSNLIIKNRDTWILCSSIISLIVAVVLILIIYYVNRHRKDQRTVLEGVIKMRQLSDKSKAEKGSMMGFVLDHFNVYTKAALLEGMLREDEKKQSRKLLDKFNETVYGRNSFDWDKATELINHIYGGFCDKLKNKYPNLDESEFRICCLTYSGLKNPDISTITGYKLNTIHAKKYSIRKKLGIDGYGKIIDFLNKSLEIDINQDSSQEEVDEAEKVS